MKRVVILCVWLFSVVAGHAQLSLDECRRLARENYPEIRQYDLVHQTEQYNLLMLQGHGYRSLLFPLRLLGRPMRLTSRRN